MRASSSPSFHLYVEDLDWSDLTEPEQMSPVLDYLGRATAKVHCVADKDSDPNIVGFQTEDEIIEVLSGNEEEFVQEMVEFGKLPPKSPVTTTGYSSTPSATAGSRAFK